MPGTKAVPVEKEQVALTPIEFILRSGVQVFTVDGADIATLVCVGSNEEQAQFVAWSLGIAHGVENKLGEGLLSMKANPIDE